jgi:multidrug efflux pump subunit AcrA (membrane-fusion protein)
VEVEVKPTDAKGQHFMVPVTAVFNAGGEQSFVWLIDSQMTAHRRPVSVAAMGAEDQIEVTAGLKAGDRIVVAGVHELEEGMKVRLLDGEGEGR